MSELSTVYTCTFQLKDHIVPKSGCQEKTFDQLLWLLDQDLPGLYFRMPKGRFLLFEWCGRCSMYQWPKYDGIIFARLGLEIHQTKKLEDKHDNGNSQSWKRNTSWWISDWHTCGRRVESSQATKMSFPLKVWHRIIYTILYTSTTCYNLMACGRGRNCVDSYNIHFFLGVCHSRVGFYPRSALRMPIFDIQNPLQSGQCKSIFFYIYSSMWYMTPSKRLSSPISIPCVKFQWVTNSHILNPALTARYLNSMSNVDSTWQRLQGVNPPWLEDIWSGL